MSIYLMFEVFWLYCNQVIGQIIWIFILHLTNFIKQLMNVREYDILQG